MHGNEAIAAHERCRPVAGEDRESAFADLGKPELVGRLHRQLDELLAARDQMEQLLQAIIEIGSHVDLDATLRRIVAAAIDLTGANYGALATRDDDGRIVTFVHAGMAADTVREIGRLPVGKGVLGLALRLAEVLRLDDMNMHPAAVGFPEHHPPMRAFLGVPIAIRGAVFGTLYVTDDRPGRVFTDSHETAVNALASAAAVAIDNAQLFDRLRASAAWIQASREITTALLSGADPDSGILRLIAERAMELTEAEQAILLVPALTDGDPDDTDALVVATAVGVHADDVIGQQVPISDSTSGTVFRTGTPVITDSLRHPIPAFTDVGQRPAIVFPLRTRDGITGVIAVARNIDSAPFDPSYLDSVGDFAAHAAVALQLATNRDRERELGILADRERIAHELHDHVIQRLFAAGLDLQGALARSRSPEMTDRLTAAVDNLQSTIGDIRAAGFRLGARSGPSKTLAHRMRQLVAELTAGQDVAVTVQTSGTLASVGSELAEHAAAVTAQAISNAMRDPSASRLTVAVTAGDMFVLEIIDDGDGQRHGDLTDLHHRAEQLGGTCRIAAPPDGGTHVTWATPLTS